MRTATPRRRKITPSSKNGRKMVRNFIRNNLRFIAVSVVKTKTTPPGSAKSSKQGIKIETILIIQKRVTRGSPEK